MDVRDPWKMAALSNLVVTMKAIEARTLGEDKNMGIFANFEVSIVKDIAVKLMKGEDVPLEALPSWHEVTQHADLKVEAFSLMRVKVGAEDIHMSQDEVKALIGDNRGSVCSEVPGSAGMSELLKAITEDEAYQTP